MVLLVEHIAAGDGLNPIMLLPCAVWESPSSGESSRSRRQRGGDHSSEASVDPTLGMLISCRCRLDRPASRLVVGVGGCLGRSAVHLAGLVVGRRIDRVELHRFIADVDHVVPRPCRYEDAPSVGHLLTELQVLFRWSHLNSAAASIQPEELISLWMHLQTDVSTLRDGHQRQLQVFAAPGDGAVVGVGQRLLFKIERLRLRSNVLDRHLALFLLAVVRLVLSVADSHTVDAAGVVMGDQRSDMINVATSHFTALDKITEDR
jgi:hypothetical protein